MDSELLWPARGDRLFVDSGLSETNAYITRTSYLTAMEIAGGYARAAELAVENAGRCDRDSIVYPVVFCYRHAVEVYLKFARSVAHRLFEVPRDSRRLEHGLSGVWDELRPLIERRWPKGPIQDLDATEKMIKELDAIDQNAQRFRYATSTKRDPHFPEVMCLDLVNFCRSGRKVINFLEGCIDGMFEAIDAMP